MGGDVGTPTPTSGADKGTAVVRRGAFSLAALRIGPGCLTRSLAHHTCTSPHVLNCVVACRSLIISHHPEHGPELSRRCLAVIFRYTCSGRLALPLAVAWGASWTTGCSGRPVRARCGSRTSIATSACVAMTISPSSTDDTIAEGQAWLHCRPWPRNRCVGIGRPMIPCVRTRGAGAALWYATRAHKLAGCFLSLGTSG